MPTLSAVTLSNDELEAVDAFWWQKVYYDGRPMCRWEVVPRLAATTGMTEEAALFHLTTAKVMGGSDAVTFNDEDGWHTTKSGHVIHVDGDGNIDKGNPHVIEKANGKGGKGGKGDAGEKGNKLRKMTGDALRTAAGVAGQKAKEALSAGGKLAGQAVKAGGMLGVKAAKAVGKAGLKLAGKAAAKGLDVGKHVAKEAVTSAVEIGKNALKDGAAATDSLAESAYRHGAKAAKGGLKLAGKVAVGAAKRIGSGIASGLKGVWSKLKGMGKSDGTAPNKLGAFSR